MIDSQLVGTGMAFIESRFLCLQINVSGYNSVQPSSVLWHFYHHLHTVYFSDVLLQSIIHCVWNKCAQWNTLWILNKVPPLRSPTPQPSPRSMTAAQNVAGGGLSGRARGDLATSSVELVWLVTQRQAPPKNVLQLYRQAWWTEGQSQPQTHAQPHGSRCHMAAPEPSAGEET